MKTNYDGIVLTESINDDRNQIWAECERVEKKVNQNLLITDPSTSALITFLYRSKLVIKLILDGGKNLEKNIR